MKIFINKQQMEVPAIIKMAQELDSTVATLDDAYTTLWNADYLIEVHLEV